MIEHRILHLATSRRASGSLKSGSEYPVPELIEAILWRGNPAVMCEASLHGCQIVDDRFCMQPRALIMSIFEKASGVSAPHGTFNIVYGDQTNNSANYGKAPSQLHSRVRD